MPSLPTGTVTFLFTDVEGSTRLLEHLGDRYADALTQYRHLLCSAVQERGGQEVDTQGDASFFAFPRARDAVAAAVAAQQGILRHPWTDGVSVRVRMGLHTGEALATETRYVGIDVHRAARISAAAHGGQILLSDTTHALVAKDLPQGVSLRDLGEHRLKDLAGPHRLFEVMAADLPADFPPLRSLDVLPNNLPVQLTSFIGREREKAEVKRLLSTTRFLTLTGSGGAGKTRLALQVAAEGLEGFPDGVWLVELAVLTDPSLVPKAVASALDVPEQPGRMLTETLADSLRGKSVLVILDNCEHLVAACAHLTTALLRACPNLRMLATSREALGVTGETTWRVPSLSLPDPQRLPPLDRFTEYEAVRLFIDRAAASAPQFAVTSSNALAVAQVCHRLDGIPLAIELAAARVKVLAVEQIAARLDDRFRLLTSGSRTALPRHQTLRAAMDWSYDLLSDRERTVLHRLSVFAGGWTLEAVEAICSGNGVEATDILDLLTQLVDKSLVVVGTLGGEARYRLTETVRQYGWDRLLEGGEAVVVRLRHLDWFLGQAEQADPRLRGPEQGVWLERLEMEHDNFRTALEYSLADAGRAEVGLRLAGALGQFWLLHGYFAEGRKWLQQALSRPHGLPRAMRAKALNRHGFIATRQGDYDIAQGNHEESLAIYERLGDKRGIAESLDNQGSLAANQGEYERALSLHAKSLAIHRELGDEVAIARVLGEMGHMAWHQSANTLARSLLEESLALMRRRGPKGRLAYVLWSLGLVAHDEHHFAEARALFNEGLTTANEVGDPFNIAFLLEAIAGTAAAEGNQERAARLLGFAEAYRQAKFFPLPRSHRSDYDRPISTIRAALDERAFAAAWAEGRAMTLEQAVEYALNEVQGSGRNPAPL